MGRKKIRNSKRVGIIFFAVIVISAIIFGTDIFSINERNNTEQSAAAQNQDINSAEPQETNQNFVSEGDLEVYFIDVGQADSILIINKNETMLIDAGNNADGKDVVKFIKDKGIATLNYVVGTHPHEDHIGGLDDVINEFEVKEVWMPNVQTTTKTFTDVLTAIQSKNLKIKTPEVGYKFELGDSKGEVMSAMIDDKNLNISSIVIRLEFGNESFLFMGDAETKNESARKWPKSNVLKVGHHGSSTSSSEEFLNQVKPEYAVIMTEKGNDYGHPHKEILERLEKIGAKIYRTDQNGTITISTDGNSLDIKTEK